VPELQGQEKNQEENSSSIHCISLVAQAKSSETRQRRIEKLVKEMTRKLM